MERRFQAGIIERGAEKPDLLAREFFVHDNSGPAGIAHRSHRNELLVARDAILPAAVPQEGFA
jgi:hypothetical protein